MNIALRTSGGDNVSGRGEYELAGTQGEFTISRIAEKRLIFQFNSQLSIDSCSKCIDPHKPGTQKKPRLRLIRQEGVPIPRHAYAWITALLMLPTPKRELDETPQGPLVITNDTFVVSAISFVIIEERVDSVIIQPTAIELKNRGGDKRSISVALRLAQIFEIWREVELRTDLVATLVNQHRCASSSSIANHDTLINASDAIQHALQTNGDYLQTLLTHFGITQIVEPSFNLPNEHLTEDILIIKRNITKQWRQVAVRGATASEFKNQVRAAYDFRCAFTGQRLPQTTITYAPGVDAAHILPWSRYDLNLVSNGICLSKLCHWAFDNGVIRLDFNPENSRYRLSIPNSIEQIAIPQGIDLDYFRGITGVIPLERLPIDRTYYPNPVFLNQLNAELF